MSISSILGNKIIVLEFPLALVDSTAKKIATAHKISHGSKKNCKLVHAIVFAYFMLFSLCIINAQNVPTGSCACLI